ncbi:transposase [Chryseobacterium tructae]|uniref:Transposase n=1 Tax=Chryseobacterium tructae TaxID=1037380 RepID=A0ABV7Y4Y5_9FLAO
MSKISKKVIGVDVGAKFLTLSFINEQNQECVFNIENNQRSILSFIRKISSQEYSLVIEATGNFSSRILHLSLSHGLEVSLINCMSVKHYATIHKLIQILRSIMKESLSIWIKKSKK